MRTPMKSRKAKSPPPAWLINTVAPPRVDPSGAHMRAHIQSLAKLDKEELAEKLFHTKVALSELQTANVRPLCWPWNRWWGAGIGRFQRGHAGAHEPLACVHHRFARSTCTTGMHAHLACLLGTLPASISWAMHSGPFTLSRPQRHACRNLPMHVAEHPITRILHRAHASRAHASATRNPMRQRHS
jgi:hypothetical protein